MKSKVTGLILSDLHLTIPKAELSQLGIEDALNGINEIKKLCTLPNPLSEGPPGAPAAPSARFDFFVLAGDIFDSISVNSVAVHLACLLKDALSNIPERYIIRGNHDRAEYSMLEDMFGWKQLYPDEVSYVRGTDITISGINFSNDAAHREYLKSAPSDIMVMHLSMKPFGGFSDNSISASDCPPDRVVIVGDTHIQAAYMQDNRCVISPGNLFPLNKAEITSGNSGSCCILSISKDKGELDVDVSPVRLETRKGASLMHIESPDELLNSLELSRLREASKGKLKPVVYVKSNLAECLRDCDDLVVIGRASGITADTDVMDVASMDDSDMLTRIRTILQTLYSGEDRSDDLVSFSLDLISSEDSDDVIEDFIK